MTSQAPSQCRRPGSLTVMHSAREMDATLGNSWRSSKRMECREVRQRQRAPDLGEVRSRRSTRPAVLGWCACWRSTALPKEAPTTAPCWMRIARGGMGGRSGTSCGGTLATRQDRSRLSPETTAHPRQRFPRHRAFVDRSHMEGRDCYTEWLFEPHVAAVGTEAPPSSIIARSTWKKLPRCPPCGPR